MGFGLLTEPKKAEGKGLSDSYLCPMAVILGGDIDAVCVHWLDCWILLFIYDTAGRWYNLNK